MALFKTPANIFVWKDIKTFLLRNQYNEALHAVITDYFTKQYVSSISNAPFLNTNYCLTLTHCDGDCSNSTSPTPKSSTGTPTTLKDLEINYQDKLAEVKIMLIEGKLDIGPLATAEGAYSKIGQEQDQKDEIKKPAYDPFRTGLTNIGTLKTTEKQWEKAKETLDAAIKAGDDATIKAAQTDYDTKEKAFFDSLALIGVLDCTALVTALKALTASEAKNQLSVAVDNLAKANNSKIASYGKAKKARDTAKDEYDKSITKARNNVEIATLKLEIATRAYNQKPDIKNEADKRVAQQELNSFIAALGEANVSTTQGRCLPDAEKDTFCLPPFEYLRKLSLSIPIKDKSGNAIPASDFDFMTHGLTVGSVIWLYYYERMGIFKILGALMDDYNYRGKYTISGSRNNDYSALMDMVCTWHRLGMSSNLRDRICLYQRTLGVSIENNLGVESERNTGFMGTFNKLLDYMLEYYKDKRLAVAINNASTGRSSVATQTSIRDTIKLLQQQFEPFEYGRNQINTFLGLATVHATICLLYNIRKEIGVPDQYESPDEFIPAAYDILVAKRAITLNETNRFIVYDNCASYGYRLLTDLQTIDMAQLQASATGGIFDLWLDDVEGWVEGYRSAYGSVPEKVEAIV